MGFVLIVDDHVDTCLIMQRIVRRIGPAARCVHSGQEALRVAGAEPPSLVLLDISMPVMDGLETLKRIRATPGCDATPIVMLTALDDAATRRRASDLGANGYMLKATFDLSSFRNMLAAYLPLDAN